MNGKYEMWPLFHLGAIWRNFIFSDRLFSLRVRVLPLFSCLGGKINAKPKGKKITFFCRLNTFAKLMEKNNGHHTHHHIIRVNYLFFLCAVYCKAKSFENLVRRYKVIVPALITLTLIRLVVSNFHLDPARARSTTTVFCFFAFLNFPIFPFRA